MTNSVERPALGWWIAIVSGIGSMAVIALSDSAYTWWAANVTAAIPRWFFTSLFAGTVAVHIAEASYAWQLAQRNGLDRSATAWAMQTFVIGFPSLNLLRAKIAAK